VVLNDSDNKAVAPILIRGKIICMALAVTPFIYLAAGIILKGQGAVPFDGMGDMKVVRWMLTVLGPACLAAGLLLRGAVIRRACKAGIEDAAEAAGVLLRSTIIGAVFCEAPAIMALVSFFFGSEIEMLILLCLVSFLGIISLMPTSGRVEMILEDAKFHRNA